MSFPLRLRRTLVAAALVLTGAYAVAQEQPKQQVGFSVRKEDDRFETALEDFQRHVGKKQWEAAFRVFTDLTSKESKGMVAVGDGFLVPSRYRVRSLLMTLPVEGREAYRLFFNPKAKQLFEQATASVAAEATDAPAQDEVGTLRKIVDQYWLTEISAAAADRLGDALYESGDYSGAAEQWRLLLTQYPDSEIPALRLHVKRACAFASAQQWEAFDEVQKLVQRDFSGHNITLGGDTHEAVNYLQTLRARSTTQPTTLPSAVAEGGAVLPESDDESWQTVFLDDAVGKAFRDRLNQMGWGGYMSSFDTWVPPSAVDEKRVYVNWLGIAFAIDLETGKLLWRTGKFSELSKAVDQFINYGLDTDRFAISQSGPHVFYVGKFQSNNHGNEPSYPISCLAADTGKLVWSTSSGPLSSYSFAGAPLMVDRTLYAVAAKQNRSSEMELLALDPQTGKQKWQMTLGTAAAGSNFRGQMQIPAPLLQMEGGMLFVLTNNGAILAVDPGSRSLRWAFKRGGPIVQNNQEQVFFSGEYMMSNKLSPPGALFSREGLLYFKEEESDAVYAIDPAIPQLKWQRPLGKSESVGGLAAGKLITYGSDAGAIDGESRKLEWSTKLPTTTGQIRPLVSGGQMVVFLGRGLYQISTDDGRVLRIVRGADRQAVGGMIYSRGGRLITVSNRAVTAYPVKQP